jgi:AAA family ATP:ADP antiporter
MLKRFVDVREEEAGAVLGSFFYFFTLMCGYFILKPLRDEMGTASGVKDLKVLWTATFVVMLVAVPLFAALVARWPRKRVIPLVYRFFLLNLLVFFVLLKSGVERQTVARAFYVWLSVYNLFVVSVFWSFMADLFASEQGKRLFGFIAGGGTLGIMVGLLLVRQFAIPLGPLNLILITMVLLEVSAQCVKQLGRWAREVQYPPSVGEPVGGGVLSGLKLLFTSPFLLGLALQTVCYTVTSSFLYILQVKLVDTVASGAAARTTAFANIELWVQGLTLFIQACITGRLISRLGMAVAMAMVPVLTGLGFLALAMVPAMLLFIGVRSIRGAAHYAFERPSREILFTTVSREEKYKAKNFIDTVVYRGGDVVGGWMEGGLTALGLGATGVLLTAMPVAGLWLGLSLYLARHPRLKRSAEVGALPSAMHGDAPAR